MTGQFLSLLKRLDEWQLLSDDRYTRDINIYLWKCIERIAINSYGIFYSFQLSCFWPKLDVRAHACDAQNAWRHERHRLTRDLWPDALCFACFIVRDKPIYFSLKSTISATVPNVVFVNFHTVSIGKTSNSVCWDKITPP